MSKKTPQKFHDIDGNEITEAELRAIQRKNAHEAWKLRVGAKGRESVDARKMLLSRAPKGVRRFFKAHGDYVQDKKTRNYIFEDGAHLENMFDDFGEQFEPPADEHERAKLIAKYHVVKERAARNKFRHYKQALLGEGQGAVIFETTEEEQAAKLVKLRDAAQKAHKLLAKAKEEVDATEPAWKAAARRQDAENLRREDRRRSRLHDINL